MEKIAIVTGSSRGIGAATAKRLAQDGYDICVNYLSDATAANDIVQNFQQQYSVKAIAVQADVACESSVERLFQTVKDQLGVPYALVNNVGVLSTQSRVSEMSAERINKILSTNVTSFFLCSKQAIQYMSTQYGGIGGVIVNVSSGAAKSGAPREYVDYAASKAAVDTFTIGLAAEVVEEGIRVNAVRPAYIYTDIHASGGESDRVNRVKSSLPLKRGGQPEEVAAAIAWFVSKESSYSTGTFIDVTGGC